MVATAPQALMDSHKLPWHMDRVRAWERGERIAPVMIDMALTLGCTLNCRFCYAQLQRNKGHAITEPIIDAFLEDCKRMGVRAVSFLSDGESTMSPVFVHTIERAAELGIPTALGSNCHMYTPDMQERTLRHLRYLRINCPAGTPKGYAEITGTNPRVFGEVCANIVSMVNIKKRDGLTIPLGLQMVLMPQDADQVLPFVQLAKNLGVDYAIIKHCADDENKALGVNYAKYRDLIPLLKQAEGLAEDGFRVHVMWRKMLEGETRPYQRCYGPPFLVQISGSGLVAPCGDKFAPQYAEKFHIGNICEQRWWDIWQSDRYMEVMNYLRSERFNAQKQCGPLCRQEMCNRALDLHMKGIQKIIPAVGTISNWEYL